MLDFITIEGFKSIASLNELKLGPINVLIGPNGSGKSNFIEVFSLLNAIRSGRLQLYVLRAGGADRVLHFGLRTTESMRVHLSFENQTNQYEIRLQATETDQLHPSGETISFRDKANYDKSNDDTLFGRGGEAGISLPPTGEIQWYVQNHLDSWRLYHFHDTSSASPLRKTADVNDNRFLRTDGTNLASFLHLLRQRYEINYHLIRRTVQLVAPFFEDFLLQPSAHNEDRIRLEWRHKGTDAYFDVSSFSDGTLRFIALATLMLQPEEMRPSVILLDEPELGLHPYTITLLASLVKQASAQSQVILATQSPVLLNHFQPEDVLVADRFRGQSEFTRLDAESLKAWLDDYNLGQLWEMNEFGGRPNREWLEDCVNDKAASPR
ncbi:MAG: AAA family ATPase [Caldilineaceae bacterium]|nr:AAA family ATPase [Caldilineaceae bacterium]